MARKGKPDVAKRTLVGFLALVAVLAVVLGGAVWRSDAELTPKLGLDLEGGTQMVLRPRLAENQTVTSEQVNQARDIIAERVDSQGTSGAEVTTQGENNIVVSMPGDPTRQQEDNLRRSSALQFRPVLVSGAPAPTPEPTETETPTESGTESPTGTESSSATESSTSESPSDSATSTSSASETSSPSETSSATESSTSTPSSTSSATSSSTESPSSAPSADADGAPAGGSTPATPARAPAPGSSVNPASGAGAAHIVQAVAGAESASETSGSESSPAETSATEPAASETDTPAEETPAEETPAEETSEPTSATDLAWITEEMYAQFSDFDCTDPGALDGVIDDPETPLITCAADGSEKFILGPVVVGGSDISDAVAGYQAAPNGQPTNIVEIQLTFDSEAADVYRDLSEEMLALESPRNRLASTLDSRVIVAPQFNEAIPGGRASITGGFSFEEAQGLAQQLKFGALPFTFDLETRSQISPTLGEEQLRMGLIAGIIGLVLVVLYSLMQYRALGLVTVASIVMAAVLTYLVITILGWAQNYRLDMAGVTGLIVAIGVTADSFIVYFERIRDEVREGRTLRTAVDTGWRRARRTILAADGVNFIAAVVLYLLASSSVRGFAFTLGLTTLIDILVVYMFTHPVVGLVSRMKFFADGHKLSGLDPERLGAKVRYVGRGRIAGPRPATAEGSAS